MMHISTKFYQLLYVRCYYFWCSFYCRFPNLVVSIEINQWLHFNFIAVQLLWFHFTFGFLRKEQRRFSLQWGGK